MSESADLDRQRLQAEIEKIKVEVEAGRQKLAHDQTVGSKLEAKLDAEIEKITAEVEAGHQKLKDDVAVLRREEVRTISTLALAVATIVGSFVTVGITASSFFKERAMARDVELDQQMIQLVGQLQSDTARVRESAALLLSSYETDAVDNLLWALKWTDEDETAQAIVQSLLKITEKSRVERRDVLDPVITAARDVAHDELRTANPQDVSDIPLTYFLEALEALGVAENRRGPDRRVRVLVQELGDMIDSMPEPPPEAVRSLICYQLKAVAAQLKQQPSGRPDGCLIK